MLDCAQQEIEAHLRGVTREQRTTTAIDSAKSQTHSATAVGFGFFSPNGSAVWPRHPRKLRAHRHQSGGMTPSKGPTRRRHAVRGVRMAQNPHRSRLKCAASPTRPGHGTGWREKTRPTPPLQQHFREKVRPALHKTPILGHFSCAGRTLSRSRPPSDQAGRTFSRTRRDNAEALKPTTPLLTPNKEPLKPASPLQPKNAPKTPVSHLQRRWRFQTHANTHEQRRHGFQTTEPPGRQVLAAVPRAAAGPGWASRRRTKRRTSNASTAGVEGAGGTGGHGRASRSTTPSRRLACGDLAGGPALRRPEHPWGTEPQATPTPHAHAKTPTRNRVGVSEPPVGIEPTTYSLRVNRSAD